MTVSYVVSTPATRDAWLHFVRFLECLCLDEGAWLPSSESVGDAVHWHQTLMIGQYR